MIYVIARIFIGLLLIISGFDKVLHPYQNFLYVIEVYDVFPRYIEILAAQVVPWVELFLGVFLLLGLYLKPVIFGNRILFSLFIIILAQALIRQLPLEDCGCFGEMISIPPYGTLIMDSLIFLCLGRMDRHLDQTKKWSLDQILSA